MPSQPQKKIEPEVSEQEIDEVLAEFGGDARAAIRALLHDMTALQLDADRATSHGFLRGMFSQGARPQPGIEEP